MSLVPRSYAEWKHCITVTSGLDRTADFATFVDTWGEAHRAQTLWFREATERLAR